MSHGMFLLPWSTGAKSDNVAPVEENLVIGKAPKPLELETLLSKDLKRKRLDSECSITISENGHRSWKKPAFMSHIEDATMGNNGTDGLGNETCGGNIKIKSNVGEKQTNTVLNMEMDWQNTRRSKWSPKVLHTAGMLAII